MSFLVRVLFPLSSGFYSLYSFIQTFLFLSCLLHVAVPARVAAALAESSSETGSVRLTRLNQNKTYEGCAACQCSLKVLDIGSDASTLLQQGGRWRLLTKGDQYQILQRGHWWAS